jgi:hypothetical protein
MSASTIAAAKAALLANPDWAVLSPEARDVIVEGELTLRNLRRHQRRTFDDWVKIGHACLELQEAAKQRSNSSSISGRRYAQAYQLLAPPELRDMDRSNRAKAIHLYHGRVAIRVWYYDQTINKQSDRDRMQHPQTILSKYDSWRRQQREQAAAGDDEPGDPKQRPDEQRRARGTAAAVDDAVVRLDATVDKIERKVSPGLELFDMDPDRIDESAENFIEVYTLPSTVRFVRALLARFTPDAVAEISRFVTTLGTPDGAPLADDAFARSLQSSARQPRRRPSSS